MGVQPSGEPFNDITLDPRTNRPFNPMLNAGAIAVAGWLMAEYGAETFDHILEGLGRAAGRPLDVDESTFASERETGHRNRAIAHLLRGAGVFDAPVDDVLDVYFRQCSVRVRATDLALCASMLANLGTHPLTGVDVFGPESVRHVLSVMFNCGMDDGAGHWACNWACNWACKVGLPAKSGVGGGIMAVVNRRMGIGVFSPRLDPAGNSVRGHATCMRLVEELGLHAFDSTQFGSTLLGAFG